jgi:16S rRNA G1207 methylase RsmC
VLGELSPQNLTGPVDLGCGHGLCHVVILSKNTQARKIAETNFGWI